MHISSNTWLLIAKKVAAFVAVVTPLTPIVLYAVSKLSSRKRLTYQVTTLDVTRTVKGMNPKLTILFGSQEVKSLTWMTVKIRNTGSVPIDVTDFRGPIEVKFSSARRILEASATRPYSARNAASWQYSLSPDIHGVVVSMAPMLLNAGFMVSLLVAVDGRDVIAELDAPIVGVRINQLYQSSNPFKRVMEKPEVSTFYAALLSGEIGAGIAVSHYKHHPVRFWFTSALEAVLLLWLAFRAIRFYVRVYRSSRP